MEDNNKKTSKAKKSALNETVLKLIEGLSPRVANLIIDAYNEVPFVVKEALDDFYNAKYGISGKDGIEAVKKALEKLKDMCEANPQYMNLYDAARDDANQEIAELYANGGMSV